MAAAAVASLYKFSLSSNSVTMFPAEGFWLGTDFCSGASTCGEDDGWKGAAVSGLSHDKPFSSFYTNIKAKNKAESAKL